MTDKSIKQSQFEEEENVETVQQEPQTAEQTGFRISTTLALERAVKAMHHSGGYMNANMIERLLHACLDSMCSMEDEKERWKERWSLDVMDRILVHSTARAGASGLIQSVEGTQATLVPPATTTVVADTKEEETASNTATPAQSLTAKQKKRLKKRKEQEKEQHVTLNEVLMKTEQSEVHTFICVQHKILNSLLCRWRSADHACDAYDTLQRHLVDFRAEIDENRRIYDRETRTLKDYIMQLKSLVGRSKLELIEESEGELRPLELLNTDLKLVIEDLSEKIMIMESLKLCKKCGNPIGASQEI